MDGFDATTFWSAYHAQLDADGVPRRFADAASEAGALRSARAARWQSRGDVLRLTGDDTLDLLHRIAASEVRDLAADAAHEVLFTTDKGRIVDLPVLVADGDAWLALCGRQQGPALADWLGRYVITEDVRIERLEQAHVLTLVTSHGLRRGDGWVEAASRVAALDEAALGRWLRLHVPDAWILVGEDAYRSWWVERGRLPAGPELSSGINPLEAGLREHVSWTKGCYVGQEVVARLDTYQKVRRQVVVLRASAALEAGEPLCDAAGKEVGRLLATAPHLAGGLAAVALVDTSLREGDEVRTRATSAVVATPAAP